MKDKTLIAAAAVVFRETKNGEEWFIVRQDEEAGWELPKTLARKGESSVRASMRMMGEQGGMNTKVLEEAGRAGGAVKIKGKPTSQRTLFYVLWFLGGEEILGFNEHEWLGYGKAVKRLSKRDASMLRSARKIQKDIAKNTDRLIPEEEV